MSRTDRLYAIVDVLRANAPAGVTVGRLAERFEVSTRTIERDVATLQQAGVPIWTETGRRGGVHIDRSFTLPPLNLTGGEAFAVAVALALTEGSPFDDAAHRALSKVAAILPTSSADGVRQLTERVRIVRQRRHDPTEVSVVAIGRALTEGRVLQLGYLDAEGAVTSREVEPMGLVVNGVHWYLVAWCRLREDARAFRLDRVRSVALGDEAVALRPFEVGDPELDALAEPVDWP